MHTAVKIGISVLVGLALLGGLAFFIFGWRMGGKNLLDKIEGAINEGEADDLLEEADEAAIHGDGGEGEDPDEDDELDEEIKITLEDTPSDDLIKIARGRLIGLHRPQTGHATIASIKFVKISSNTYDIAYRVFAPQIPNFKPLDQNRRIKYSVMDNAIRIVSVGENGTGISLKPIASADPKLTEAFAAMHIEKAKILAMRAYESKSGVPYGNLNMVNAVKVGSKYLDAHFVVRSDGTETINKRRFTFGMVNDFAMVVSYGPINLTLKV